MKYYLYILQTVDDTLYTGIALDPVKRFYEHKFDKIKGAKYTKSHPPKEIVYLDIFEDKSSASKEEYRIKKMLNRAQKIKLIEENKEKTKKLLEFLQK